MATKQEIAAKLAEIPDDEPLFLLRGRDLMAPEAIDSWCTLGMKLGVNDKKVGEAYECMHDMLAYESRRLPD